MIDKITFYVLVMYINKPKHKMFLGIIFVSGEEFWDKQEKKCDAI